ncbi:MAG TPA: HepT-like ribonuclease domain-containing protein [Bryobacteraceae bacterium]|nr:HepT-like ribonuclease domain-containing protein [Bryobacteraceae bacterium]
MKRVSPTTRGKHPEAPGMRDRLIHGYDSVDLDELWKTASTDIPALLERVRTILAIDFGQ